MIGPRGGHAKTSQYAPDDPLQQALPAFPVTTTDNLMLNTMSSRREAGNGEHKLLEKRPRRSSLADMNFLSSADRHRLCSRLPCCHHATCAARSGQFNVARRSSAMARSCATSRVSR